MDKVNYWYVEVIFDQAALAKYIKQIRVDKCTDFRLTVSVVNAVPLVAALCTTVLPLAPSPQQQSASISGSALPDAAWSSMLKTSVAGRGDEAQGCVESPSQSAWGATEPQSIHVVQLHSHVL